MKKNALIYVYAFLLTGMLSSCMNKENDSENSGSETPEPISADISYQAVGGADMVSVFDITVSYTAANGKPAQEKISQLPWIKQIHVDSIPFEAIMSVNYVGKQKYPDKESYQVGSGLGILYETSNGKQGGGLSESTDDWPKAIIGEYLSEYPQIIADTVIVK
jgi:hypothetical protein